MGQHGAGVALPQTADVVVVGGGPAGAAAARLLASWGHAVVLADRPPHRPHLAESLPPSCEGLLDAVGVRDLVDAAGFVRSTGNTVWWGAEPRRIEYFPAGRLGHQVRRGVLDQVLRDAAASAGALVRHPATVRAVLPAGDGYDVRIEEQALESVVRARWVLDATGRGGLLARGDRRRTGSARTLALAGVWARDGGWDLPDETHTLVESVPHGWGWSVPEDREHRFVTVMLNPREDPLPGDLATRYHQELDRLPAFRVLVAQGRLVSSPWACDATTYTADPVVGDTALLLGDAASFIDPLSSFGVKKALASGWLGAIVVNTALRSPAMREAAVSLFAARERAYVAAASRELATLASDAAGDQPERAFWRARRSLAGDDVDEQHVHALRSDAAVQEAFALLRTRSDASLRLDERTRLEPRPLVRGSMVVTEPHLIAEAFPAGVRFLRNVDLIAVVHIAERENDVGRMYDTYQQAHGATSLPDFLGALAVLVGKRVCRFA